VCVRVYVRVFYACVLHVCVCVCMVLCLYVHVCPTRAPRSASTALPASSRLLMAPLWPPTAKTA
jgi:hypothetical protein